MNKHDSITLWTLSLIDAWNDKNPQEKLHPDLIKLVNDHFNYVYVSGVDAMAAQIIPALDAQETSQISKHYIRTLIQSLKI